MPLLRVGSPVHPARPLLRPHTRCYRRLRPVRALPEDGSPELSRRQIILQVGALCWRTAESAPARSPLPAAASCALSTGAAPALCRPQSVNWAILGDLVGTDDARTVVNSILGALPAL